MSYLGLPFGVGCIKMRDVTLMRLVILSCFIHFSLLKLANPLTNRTLKINLT